MSLFGALNAGVAGMNAQSRAIGHISDNLANVQTVGYKRVDTKFETLVTSSNAGSHVPGGVISSPVYRNGLQGNLIGTQSATDIAIKGAGFFAISDRPDGQGTFYSRRGDFSLDRRGYMVNGAGQYLRGWPVNTNANGDITVNASSPKTIQIDPTPVPPKATTTVTYGANLPSNAAVREVEEYALTTGGSNLQVVVNGTTIGPLAGPFGTATAAASALAAAINADATLTGAGYSASNAGGVLRISGPTDGSSFTSSNLTGTAPFAAVSPTQAVAGVRPAPFTSSMTAYDTLGNEHTVNLTWTKLPQANFWQLDVNIPTATSGGSLGPYNAQFDTDGKFLGFDTNGSLASLEDTDGIVTMAAVTFPGAAGQNLTLDFAAEGLTQFADAKRQLAPRGLNQDGYGAGQFRDLVIDEEGFVTANYTNGTTRTLYQIPLANFANPGALVRADGGYFVETRDSGMATMNAAGSGGTGGLTPSALEGSNVDIADEFSKMIVTQRVFSANAKTISTSDDMLEQVIQLKR
ncbi:MAG TPA: flagellar hook protein FlgE [Azospirillaceae bacterium]|nr:flagellar hook protein FlgE [Azospirillaceae bacterium]